ncbi:GNAT family N-acetyltransferase [Nocardia beijingensis]|uniref:GNAT family N-acetyltransferase n=1 Tax=Nocardia beijingensis TaxID=95162 RepID=UPI001894056C|nr:GNAT family N-acetyltransferase [Nocardia beijingensis]
MAELVERTEGLISKMALLRRYPPAAAGDHVRKVVEEVTEVDKASAATIDNASRSLRSGDFTSSGEHQAPSGGTSRDWGREEAARIASGPVTVRDLTPDDWERSREMSLRRITDSPDSFATTVEEARARPERVWRELVASRKANLMVLKEGRPIAEVKINAVTGRETEVELTGMFVVPEHRGTGAGDLLVTKALEWARNHGYQRVERSQREDNIHAERLYTRHGFVRVGYEPSHYPDGTGLVRMARKLH